MLPDFRRYSHLTADAADAGRDVVPAAGGGVSAADVVCLGELLVDMFAQELGRRLGEVSAFRPVPGGAPANVAVAAARQGARAAFIGKVGDDPFGHHLAEVVRAQGVNVEGLRFDPEARTTLAFAARPDPNTSEFLFYRNPGADTRLRPDELDRELIGGAKAFHFGSISLTDEPVRSATLAAVQAARQTGAIVSFDVNYRPLLWKSAALAREIIWSVLPVADIVKVNARELELLTGQSELAAAARLLEPGPRLCVVTLASEGSYFHTAHASGHVPGFAVDTVDATGCGDAFMGALLFQLTVADPAPLATWSRKTLNADRLERMLRYANAAGALTARTLGVIPALPTAAQVEAFLEQVTARLRPRAREGEDGR